MSERPFPYSRLLLWAVAIGIAGGLVSTTYYFALKFGLNLLWNTLPYRVDLKPEDDLRYYVWIITMIGGLLVGLSVHYLGAAGGMDVAVDEIHTSGRIDYRQLPGMIVASLLSLIFGSSAGPEAPLLDISGGLASWLGDRLKLPTATIRLLTFCGMSAAAGAFFDSPLGGAIFVLEVPHRRGLEYYEGIIPSLISATLGFAIFRFMAGLTIGGLFEFPPSPELQPFDLIFAAILGAVGAAVAIAFMILFQAVGHFTQSLAHRPILLITLGGLAIGLIATFLPQTLFYGEEQIQTIIDTGHNLGVGFLLLIALGKMLALSLCLKTGFRGGFLFPLFFIGAVVGMAVSLIVPQISTTVCMVCMMAAVSVAVMKTPVGLVIILTAISHTSMLPLIVTATLVSYLLTTRASLIKTQRSRVL